MPNRLRGVAWPVDVDDVRPKPSCDQRTLTTPWPMRARLRTACTATCGSLAQAWTHRSPPLRAGSSSSPWNGGRACSGSGRRAAMPKRSRPSAVVNSVGPKPTVRVRPEAGSPMASPVSSRGAYSLPATAPIGPASCPAVIRRAAAVQSWSSLTRTSRSSVMTSKATKCSRSCCGVVIPAWWRPVKAMASDADDALSGGVSVARAMVPPATPPTATPAAPIPARPNSRRREIPRAGWSVAVSCSLMWLLLRDHRGHLADLRGQCVDRIRQGAQLVLRELGVRRPGVAGVVLLQLGRGGPEPLVEGGRQPGVPVGDDRPQRLHRLLRPLEVGREVVQIRVRVAVLLARDLPGGDLVEQAERAVGQVQRPELEVLRPGGQVVDVAHQLVGDRAGLRDVAGLPQVALEHVEAGPGVAGLDVVLTGVDLRVEVAEALGHRLHPLLGGLGGRVEGPGPGGGG